MGCVDWLAEWLKSRYPTCSSQSSRGASQRPPLEARALPPIRGGTAPAEARSTFVTKPDNKVSRLLKSLLKEMREVRPCAHVRCCVLM
jgi:hypothetical protein